MRSKDLRRRRGQHHLIRHCTYLCLDYIQYFIPLPQVQNDKPAGHLHVHSWETRYVYLLVYLDTEIQATSDAGMAVGFFQTKPDSNSTMNAPIRSF